jgi:membrane-bound metal-dependent hydrolase YbcI (DUF457 family)
MLNATHGPAGALAGVGAATGLAAAGAPATVQAGVIVGAVVGGLLPDTDHHASTVARMWGPLTAAPCLALGHLAGGHRAATHDVSKGAPALFGAAFAVGLLAPAAAARGIVPDVAAQRVSFVVVALIAGLTLVSLDAAIPGKWTGRPVKNLAASLLLAWLVTSQFPAGLPPVVVAGIGGGVALGALVGGIGLDACTVQGVPFRGRRRHVVPAVLRVTTGGGGEGAVRAVVWVALVVSVLAWSSPLLSGRVA